MRTLLYITIAVFVVVLVGAQISTQPTGTSSISNKSSTHAPSHTPSSDAPALSTGSPPDSTGETSSDAPVPPSPDALAYTGPPPTDTASTPAQSPNQPPVDPPARGPVVVIDPGHGGQPAGIKSSSAQEGDGASWNNTQTASKRILEKDLTLSYAKAIQNAFENSEQAKALGVRVVLTRDTDMHLGAMERASVAVRESAAVFLSIHFNASSSHKAEGTRAYFVSGDHPDWEYIHFTNPYEERDRQFCESVCAAVAYALQPFGGKPERHVTFGDVRDRKDGLRMLGYARLDTHLLNTAIGLLEVEFMDNPEVEKWLLSDANKDRAEKAVADAIAKATCDWLSLPPEQRDAVTKPRKAPGRGAAATPELEVKK